VIVDVVVIALLLAGTAFFVAGTVGLLRFPDLPTRLHAVAKADNLGLGLIVVALIIDEIARDPAPGAGIALKLLLVWTLALVGTAANSHLLAGHARADETAPERAADATVDREDEAP